MRRERTETALGYELRVEAPPELVFEYFTDPAKLTRWIGEAAVLDPRPGGAFRLEFDREHIAVGTFREVVPHRRVEFTWGWEGGGAVPPGASVVEVTFDPDGDDATVVRLRHDGLPEGSLEAHDEGWSRYLARLPEATRTKE